MENTFSRTPLHDSAMSRPTGMAAIRRVSWGAVFGGVVIALVVMLALSLLGMGIGLSTVNPMTEQNPVQGLGTGAIIWWVISMLIALFTGGYVAGRLAGMPLNQDALLHGLLTWALFTLLTFYLLTTAVGRIIGGVGSVLGDAVSLAGRGVQAVAPEIAGSVDIDLTQVRQEARQLLRQTGQAELQPENLEQQANAARREVTQGAGDAAQNPQQADAEADDVIDKLFARGQNVASAADRDAAVNVIMARTGKSREEANQIVNNWQATYQQARNQVGELGQEAEDKARQAGESVASAVSKAAFYAFIGLVLGAVAAGFGGRMGVPKDALGVGENEVIPR